MIRRAAKLVVWLAVAAALVCALRQWGFCLRRVEGTSMSDTLTSGEIVLVTRFDYLLGGTPARGDVVLCRFPGRSGSYLKRVVGLPGETIELEGEALRVNGVEIAESYVSSPADAYAITLGADQYLLLGDNRAESYDSREADMGPVSSADLLGRVRLAFNPLRGID